MEILLAPNGKPSNLTPEQYKLVRTSEFVAWFGNWMDDPNNASKVVDENGEPLVCFHGGKINNILKSVSDFDKGIYFTSNKYFAQDVFALQIELKERDKTNDYDDVPEEMLENSEWDEKYFKFAKVYSVFLNLRKPQIFDSIDAKSIPKNYEIGFDGFIAKYTDDFGYGADQIIAFEPNQIKLADGSNTTFDSNNEDIRFDEGGGVPTLLAPNGKPSNLTSEQYKLVRTPEFIAWFGNWMDDPKNASKVIDENGEPLVCFHGTDNSFHIFDKSKIGDNHWQSKSVYGGGFFFTDKKNKAFSGIKYEVFLNIKKPLINTFSDKYGYEPDYYDATDNFDLNSTGYFQTAKENRNNGIIIKTPRGSLYVAFQPKQIKLADGTNTTFDPKNPDIRYAGGGGVPSLLAPNGKPSNLNTEQYKFVRSESFKAFFGDWEKLALTKINDSGIDEVSLKRLEEGVSKVVDENGEPLVVLHATTHDFNVFSNDEDTKRRGVSKEGIFFTDSTFVAETYIYKNLTPTPKQIKSGVFFKENSNIMPVFLSLQNPLIVDAGFTNFNSIGEKQKHINDFISIAKKHNKDGLIVKNVKDLGSAVDFLKDGLFATTYIVFKPNQIKSAIGNNGNFDTNNPDIRFAFGGGIKATTERFRPTETVNFNPPLVGTNGNKLISYTWKYDYVVDVKEGEDISKRVSDWTQAETNAETGRDIVHVFDVLDTNGKLSSVSSESVPVALGFITNDQKKSFINLATSAKTLAKQQLQLSILKAKNEEIEKVRQEIIDAGYPEITYPESSWNNIDEDNLYMKMGDGSVVGYKSNPNNPERLTALKDSYIRSEMNKRGFSKSKYDTYDLEQRIIRQEKKVQRLAESKTELFKGGGDIKEALLAPNGKPSNLTHEQYKLVRTPAFKQWFGDWENDPNDNMLIDENGEPMVWWHTGGDWTKLNNDGIDGKGKLMFSPTKSSMAYGKDGKQTTTRPFFIKSDFIYMLPYEDRDITSAYRWNKNKKNPIWFVNAYGGFVVVRQSNQIKLADGTNTTFDPNNEDIRFAEGGGVPTLLAPNGKPSNLTPEQYELVRSKSFISWFGDWLNDPENASKVVDENGEPLVVYRGNLINQEELGYVFNLGKNFLRKENDNQFGFFFTNELGVAKKYMLVNHFDEIEGGSITSVFIKTNKILNLLDFGLKIGQDNFIDSLIEKGVHFDNEYNYLETKIRDFDADSYKGWGYNVFDYFDVFPDLRNLFIKNGFYCVVFYEMSRMYNKYKVYVAFEPNQIKLADGTNTTFDPNNPDIRYAGGGGVPALLAPNGKPSNLSKEQYELVRSKPFISWFGDWLNDPKNASKVVDENGEPLVVYHGTNSIFTIFDKEFQNTKTGFGDFGAGFYFTSSFGTAKYYTLKSENNRIIMLVFLKIMNPFIIELNWEKLSEQSIINYKGLEGLSDLDKDFLNNTFKDDYRPSKAITKHFSDYGFQELLIRNDFDGVVINRINIYEKPDINHENQIQYFNEIVVFEPEQIKLTDGTNTTFDTNNPDIRYEGGGFVSFKDKYNKKFGYPTSTSHNLKQISKDTRVSLKGLQQIYNKGIGAFKTNPSSVRPTVKSKEQWAMARVYSAVMGGKASKIDSNELKMKNGGGIPDNYIHVVNNFGNGETLNKVFNEWSNIQSEKDQANWSMRVKLLRFGTYQQFTLLDVMEKFDFDKSDKINGILKRDFKNEVESAYDNEIITINKNNEMKKESETFGGGGGVNDNFPIVKLKIYANNPSYNKRYFESEALFDFSNEKIKFINIDTFGDDYRFNWIKVKENSKGFYIDFEYYGGRIYIENYINLFDQEKNKKKLAGGGGVAAKSSHTLNSNKGKIAINLDSKWNDIEIMLVPISFIAKCSEFNRRNDPKYSLDDSAKNIENIKKSFIENGITEPLILNYIKNESKLLLTEGNHRLNALIELEVPYYPVCVTVIGSWTRGKGKGVKTKVKPYMITEINKSKYLSVDNFEGVPYVNIENNHINVNETDTLTINVPLLIRLFEYIREDVDNDAQIHFLTENILKLKNKPELSMIDYDSIIDGVKPKKTAEKILALGGLAEGPPHSEGGIPLVVKSTGQNIEIEGGELVVNKFSSSETEKFEFEGKELTPCEIVSELNSMDNNGVKIDCNKIVGRFKKEY
jgi:hypothetical protein